jgi:hypothetical protein
VEIWLLYAAIVLVYVPGLIAIVKLDYIGRLPIVLFCFLGLFVFNALGSILVLLKKSSFSGVPLVSTEYVLMLVGQACLFYLIVGPYVLRKSHMAGRHLEVRPLAIQTADRWFTVVLAASIVLILTLYYQEVGSFLIFDLFSGQLHTHTALPLRMKKSYGLEHFFLYRFGFFVFPALLACLLTFMCLIERRMNIGRVGLFLFCLLPPLLLAEKAGVLWVVLNVLIGYVFFVCYSGKHIVQALNGKVALLALAASLPTLAITALYYNPDQQPFWGIIKVLQSRIFSAYAESLAGIVPLVREDGLFYGSTLPSIHGLLPHERVILENEMHRYLVGRPGVIPVPALGEGYANFGWAGFVTLAFLSFGAVVVLQEFFLRFRLGLISYTWQIWYAHLAMMLATTSVFATLISLTYTASFCLVVAIYLILMGFSKRIARPHPPGVERLSLPQE